VNLRVSSLRCEECGQEAAPGERGWRAFRTDLPAGVDDGGDDDPRVVFYCPVCGEREFGAGQATGRAH